MKRIHLLPNVITAFGLSCGLFVIFKMTMLDVAEVDFQVLTAIAGILLLAAFADLLDGAVARAMKAQSDFGGLFDSMTDAVTFGVGPSVIVLKSIPLASGTELSFLLTTAAMVFSVCGVLRLVRFNLMAQKAKADPNLEDANNKNFTGMPIPAGAAAAVSANLFLISPEFRYFFTISETSRALIMIFAMIVLGYFMISRWKFPSLKNLHIRVASFQVVFVTVVTAALLFYGLLHHFAVVFFCCSWAYLGIAGVLSLIRLISGRKSKTLEDFEPDHDEIDIE
ncbi:MAG: CDP-alcohol phosphatidyltransferase family protein [Parachlamydiaceae bacterium]|nr:CDP-alcohol phosphatidyltransferase family protein [Parachlamydiaceae bacterium]